MNITKLYSVYHKHRKLQKKIIDENNFTYFYTLKLLKPYIKRGKRVLDIGCGTGTLSLYLASKGMEVTGIDISQKAIKICKINAMHLGIEDKINFFRSTFPRGNLKGKYDLIILSEVIEHIENERLAVKKITNLLKKDSILVITTPSADAPLYKMGLLNKFDEEVGHLRRYTFESLLNLFVNKDIEILSLTKNEGFLRNFFFTNQYAGHLLRYINRLLPKLFNKLDEVTAKAFGESDIQIVLKKTK